MSYYQEELMLEVLRYFIFLSHRECKVIHKNINPNLMYVIFVTYFLGFPDE